MKKALENLPSIENVTVSTQTLDHNNTGSRAMCWHVTFMNFENAGDLPLLTVDLTNSNITGSSAFISVKESRKGRSNVVQRLRILKMFQIFTIDFEGVTTDNIDNSSNASSVEYILNKLGVRRIYCRKRKI